MTIPIRFEPTEPRLFTARCYAELRYATVLSVRLSVRDMSLVRDVQGSGTVIT